MTEPLHTNGVSATAAAVTTTGGSNPADVAPDSRISASEGRSYWQSVEADVDGMLGGFTSISTSDLVGSRIFLARLGIGTDNTRRRVERVLEGGAGIGRVTEGLILQVAERVDVIEPIEKFTADLALRPGVGTVHNIGLEEWVPEEGAVYDFTWTQWCVGHLTDEQLVAYLRRCRDALKPEGFIVVKDNLSTSGVDLYDEIDSSVTRTDEKFRLLFEQAGLQIIREERQRGFPRDIFPVSMYALK